MHLSNWLNLRQIYEIYLRGEEDRTQLTPEADAIYEMVLNEINSGTNAANNAKGSPLAVPPLLIGGAVIAVTLIIGRIVANAFCENWVQEETANPTDFRYDT